MVILIDTNVIVDFLTTREPFYSTAARLIQKCADGEVKGYIAFHSIPNLWYILRSVPEEKRRAWLMDLCSFMRVVGVEHEEVVRALERKEFSDFEDCLQDRCAKSVAAAYIVTRNTKDFTASEVPAILPERLIELI